jgi:hypothetical protein
MQEVWSQIITWEHFANFDVAQQGNFASIADWWEHTTNLIHKEHKRTFFVTQCGTSYLWKERNRRIFENVHSMIIQVAGWIKDYIDMYKRAHPLQPVY